MNKNKLASALLAITTLVVMVGAPLANAQTSTSSLATTIASLQAQIASLTAELNSTTGTTTTGTTTGAATYNFTGDLTVGSTGSAVMALQQFLIGQGDLVLATPTTYFGAMTQKALAKYQAANNIAPAAGYFGPKTRAFVNSLSTTSTSTTTTTTTTTTGSTLPAGCTSTSLYSQTTGLPCSTTTGTTTGTNTSVNAPATGLLVTLASQSSATSLVAGAARTPVETVNLTAGNAGAATVTSISFQKNGVVSDNSVSGAYLTQNGQVLAQYSSLTNGVLTFSGLNLSIPAGQTLTLTLAIDLSGSSSAGNTVSFSMPSASSVTAFSSSNTAITPTGSFPLSGNTLTVTTVTSPALATLQLSSTSIGTSVNAGTQAVIVGSWTAQVNNSAVYLQNLNFHVIGSANMANIQNVKLMVNGSQVGATVPTVSNGMVDFSGNIKLNTGTSNIQVVADVMGSPNYNFQFEILNTYDVLAVDSQYNVPIAVTTVGGAGTQVLINPGQITLSQDANTPTGNIAKVSNVTLAKFDLYAAGEAVKVQYLDFQITLTGAKLPISQELKNISLVDDAGNQVGTTINTPPSSNTCEHPVTYSTSSAAVYADCFGTNSSQINYIIPANTTRVLSLKADVQNTADFTSVVASLPGNAANLQGQISSKQSGTGSVMGVTLTLVNSSISASTNNALGSQNVSAGTSNLKIGSYSLSASSAEGVNINTVSITSVPASGSQTAMWLGTGAPTAFQNLRLYVNGTQFGTTQNTVTPGGVSVFSGSPFTVPAGSTVNVDVYADTLSSATGTYQYATGLSGYTGTGATSYTAVNSNTLIPGQQVNFNGKPGLSVGADSSNPASSLVAQGTANQTLAVYRLTETSNVEAVKVTQLNIVDTVSSSSSAIANFSNLQLLENGVSIGTASAASSSGSGVFVFKFNSFTSPLVVPSGSSVSLTLTGTAGTYNQGSITDNTSSTFVLATSSIVAYGNTSNIAVNTVGGSASSNAQTVVRSSESVTATPVISSTPLPASTQQIGSITINSSNAGDTVPQSLMLTFSGNGVTSTFLASSSLYLKDVNGNKLFSATTTANTVTWASSTLGQYVVSANGSYTFTLWGNLANAVSATTNTTNSLTAQIVNAGDYTYNDANSTTGAATLSLTPVQVPITVVSLSSQNGGAF
jgi:hypothetical protein